MTTRPARLAATLLPIWPAQSGDPAGRLRPYPHAYICRVLGRAGRADCLRPAPANMRAGTDIRLPSTGPGCTGRRGRASSSLSRRADQTPRLTAPGALARVFPRSGSGALVARHRKRRRVLPIGQVGHLAAQCSKATISVRKELRPRCRRRATVHRTRSATWRGRLRADEQWRGANPPAARSRRYGPLRPDFRDAAVANNVVIKSYTGARSRRCWNSSSPRGLNTVPEAQSANASANFR